MVATQVSYQGVKMFRSRLGALAVAVVFSTFFCSQTATASVIGIGVGAFGPGSTLTTFTGLADGTEVNGLTVDGILFQYSLGNGQVVIDGGPGFTNNVSPPNIVSTGNNSGILTLTLPSLIDEFGYGYAVLNDAAVLTATTISLFNGATPVGGLSYNGVPDPTFAGGFAGIQSTLPFNRVELTFNSVSASAFAADNFRTFNSAGAAIPEPASLAIWGLSALGGAIGAYRRRKQSA
jgi:hypothetical protein